MKVLVGSNPMGVEDAIPDLEKKYPEVEFVHHVKREDLPDSIANADVYLGWLSRDLFLAAKKLRWIQSPSSGTNNYMAIPEIVESDVLVTSASGTHGACLAESVLGMIFAFTRGIRASIAHQQQCSWGAGGARSKMVELTDSAMGIIGFGTVGRALAKRAQAFDMRIMAVDLYPANKPDYVSELWDMNRLHDLLSESDYAVVTVPYTPQTDGMIGAEQLALMKPSAMLVGISRGRIIDQEALAQALRGDRLAAAALDVCHPEPLPPESELWKLENLLITPHIAGGTQFEGKHIVDIFSENLGRLLRDDLPLRNQVDKQKGF